MANRLPPAPLKAGDRVLFGAGSPQWREGFREAVVVSVTTHWVDHVRGFCERNGEDASGMIASAIADGEGDLVVPIVEVLRGTGELLAFPCHETFLVKIDGPPPTLIN